MGMNTPRWTVVIVDDHAPSRAATAEAVSSQGWQVLGNGSRAEDALRLIDAHRPDVLICAVGLPETDGVEITRKVMAAAACPVVLLTSHTDPAVSARAIEAGALGFLVKPLRAEELGPALDLAVSRFREMQAVRRENETLRRSLEGRKLIERAKGILMDGQGLKEAEAFRRIQKLSMNSRKSMREVAEAIVLAQQL